MFHVEHAPIEKPAPHIRCAIYQQVTVWFHQYQGQASGKLADLRQILTVFSRFPVFAGSLQSKPVLFAALAFCLGKYAESGLDRTNQLGGLRGSKGPASRQYDY